MRLKPAQVKMVCQRILQNLQSSKLISVTKGEPAAMSRMEEIFLKDLKVEDQINQEAEKILAKYESQMGDSVDREKMFQMIKKQLIKDKGVIL